MLINRILGLEVALYKEKDKVKSLETKHGKSIQRIADLKSKLSKVNKSLKRFENQKSRLSVSSYILFYYIYYLNFEKVSNEISLI